jgi:hypothetical protein
MHSIKLIFISFKYTLFIISFSLERRCPHQNKCSIASIARAAVRSQETQAGCCPVILAATSLSFSSLDCLALSLSPLQNFSLSLHLVTCKKLIACR